MEQSRLSQDDRNGLTFPQSSAARVSSVLRAFAVAPGETAAIERMSTLSLDELQSMSMTQELAQCWAAFYANEALLNPTNGSARGRAKLMQFAADLFGAAK